MPRKNKSTAPAAPRPLTGPQRLNKVLAAAGLGSRRDCEQFILDGRIEVDGQPVTDLATKVDAETAKITFDGSALKAFRPVYYALHKPSGVLSTNSDPSGRMRAIDLVNVKERIFSVGRLDRFSEGLMLLTNDGELAQRLAHPRFGVQKLYLATVQGDVTQIDLEKLVRGVRLSEGFAKVDAVKLRRQRSGAAELEIALSEGKNREIRRILARLGHKVVGLKRLAIGPLRLGQLPVGGWRPLSREEILALYSTTSHRKKRRGPSRPPRTAGSAPENADEPMSIGTSVGHFQQPFDEDDDDDFGPPPIYGDESSYDDESEGDDEIIALSGQSVVGTVIPYEEESASGKEDRRRGPQGERTPRSGRSQSDRQRTGSRTAARSEDRSGASSASTSSPYDLRNRQPRSSSSGSGSNRPVGRGSAQRSSTSRTAGPRTAGPRTASPRIGARTGGSRTGSSGSTGARTGAPRSDAARSAAPRTGGTRSASRTEAPRTGAPRSSGPRSGGAGVTAGPRGPRTGPRSSATRSSGPRSSGPRTGGPSGGASSGNRTSGNKSNGSRISTGKPSTGKPGAGKFSTGKPRGSTSGSTGRSSLGGGGGASRGAGPKGKRGGGKPPTGGGGSGARGKRK